MATNLELYKYEDWRPYARDFLPWTAFAASCEQTTSILRFSARRLLIPRVTCCSNRDPPPDIPPFVQNSWGEVRERPDLSQKMVDQKSTTGASETSSGLLKGSQKTLPKGLGPENLSTGEIARRRTEVVICPPVEFGCHKK